MEKLLSRPSPGGKFLQDKDMSTLKDELERLHERVGKWQMFFVVREPRRISSNMYELHKFRFNKDISRNWFNRMVDKWNRLGSFIMRANMMDMIKKRLNKLMD